MFCIFEKKVESFSTKFFQIFFLNLRVPGYTKIQKKNLKKFCRKTLNFFFKNTKHKKLTLSKSGSKIFIIKKKKNVIKIFGKKREKNFKFFSKSRFYTGRKNFTNKSCLFYAKFFEFEEFFIEPFFWGSI